MFILVKTFALDKRIVKITNKIKISKKYNFLLFFIKQISYLILLKV